MAKEDMTRVAKRIVIVHKMARMLTEMSGSNDIVNILLDFVEDGL